MGERPHPIAAPPKGRRRSAAAIRARLLLWGRRYLPAELSGTVAAMGAATLAHDATGNLGTTALAGAWAENVGYYAVIVAGEVRRHWPAARALPLPARLRLAAGVARDLGLEFGPAELLDSLLVRPGLMYAFATVVPSAPLAILLGKLAADVVFYVLAITSFEWTRRRSRVPAPPARVRPRP